MRAGAPERQRDWNETQPTLTTRPKIPTVRAVHDETRGVSRFIVVRNPLYRVTAFGVSLAIVAVIYFAVIKPNHDTANNAAKQGEQQLQQAVSNANKANPGVIPANVQSLTACIAAAGTNTGELQACNAKFTP